MHSNRYILKMLGSCNSHSLSASDSPDHESNKEHTNSDSKESLRRSVENLFNLRYGIGLQFVFVSMIIFVSICLDFVSMIHDCYKLNLHRYQPWM